MKTIIKKPLLNSVVKSEKHKLEGKVVEITGYSDTFECFHPERLQEENKRLKSELGDDYKDIYFEFIVEITDVEEESEYFGDKIAVFTWKDYLDFEVASYY